MYIVQAILAIPLSSRSHNGRWIWGEDKGLFSVQSSYFVTRRLNFAENSPVFNSTAELLDAPVSGKG